MIVLLLSGPYSGGIYYDKRALNCLYFGLQEESSISSRNVKNLKSMKYVSPLIHLNAGILMMMDEPFEKAHL